MVKQAVSRLPIVALPSGQAQPDREALPIDDRVDFRRPAATADADGLILLPPFAPLAARCAFTIVLSIM